MLWDAPDAPGALSDVLDALGCARTSLGGLWDALGRPGALSDVLVRPSGAVERSRALKRIKN